MTASVRKVYKNSLTVVEWTWKSPSITWWLSHLRKNFELRILLNKVLLWLSRHTWMSPSWINLNFAPPFAFRSNRPWLVLLFTDGEDIASKWPLAIIVSVTNNDLYWKRGVKLLAGTAKRFFPLPELFLSSIFMIQERLSPSQSSNITFMTTESAYWMLSFQLHYNHVTNENGLCKHFGSKRVKKKNKTIQSMASVYPNVLFSNRKIKYLNCYQKSRNIMREAKRVANSRSISERKCFTCDDTRTVCGWKLVFKSAGRQSLLVIWCYISQAIKQSLDRTIRGC